MKAVKRTFLFPSSSSASHHPVLKSNAEVFWVLIKKGHRTPSTKYHTTSNEYRELRTSTSRNTIAVFELCTHWAAWRRKHHAATAASYYLHLLNPATCNSCNLRPAYPAAYGLHLPQPSICISRSLQPASAAVYGLHLPQPTACVSCTEIFSAAQLETEWNKTPTFWKMSSSYHRRLKWRITIMLRVCWCVIPEIMSLKIFYGEVSKCWCKKKNEILSQALPMWVTKTTQMGEENK
jgi:hypothetical protein